MRVVSFNLKAVDVDFDDIIYIYMNLYRQRDMLAPGGDRQPPWEKPGPRPMWAWAHGDGRFRLRQGTSGCAKADLSL